MRLDKKRLASIFLLLMLTIVPLHNLLSSEEIMRHPHYWDSSFFMFKSIEKHIFEFKSIYFWSPYEYTGVPLLGHPETFLISLPLLLLLLLKSNTILAINLTIIISFFLAGLGTYFLFYELKKSHKAAIIAAMIFMFNGTVYIFGVIGNLSIIVPLSLMPFIFLFIHKALYGKNTISFVLVASVLSALQIHAGGMIIFLYTFILVSGYSLFRLLGKNMLKNVIKIVLVLFILGTFTLGLSAVKLLPTFEFQDTSSRQDKFSYGEFLGGDGHVINGFKGVFTNLVRGKGKVTAAPQIGFAALFLFLLGLLRIKNKKVLFFTIVALCSVLVASGTFLAKIAYDVIPFFGNLKNVDRFLVLFAFSASMIAGFGYSYLEKFLVKIKLLKNKEKYIFLIVLLILGLELVIFKDFHQTTPTSYKKNIELLDFIAQDEEVSRVHYYFNADFGLGHVVGSHGKSSIVLLDKGIVTGGGTIWPRNIGQFLFIAGQQQSTVLWGLLNVKYIISDGPAKLGDAELVKIVEPCEVCTGDLVQHTHVYENPRFLPRSYVVDNGILVLGGNQNTIFPLLLHQAFNPKNTVIITGKDIKDYDPNELRQYKAVVLNRNLDQEDLTKLKIYTDGGGIIVPDIFAQKTAITNEDLEKILLDNGSNEIHKVEIERYTANEVKVNIKSNKKFLVISETYAHFPGWSATLDGKHVEVLKANAAISAVALNGKNGNVIFEYRSAPFRKGMFISLITLIILISYFGYGMYRKRKKK